MSQHPLDRVARCFTKLIGTPLNLGVPVVSTAADIGPFVPHILLVMLKLAARPIMTFTVKLSCGWALVRPSLVVDA